MKNNAVFLILLIVISSCNNKTAIPGQNAKTLQSCFSHNPATHALIWVTEDKKITGGREVIEYPIKATLVNFEAGTDDRGNKKVETGLSTTFTRQGTQNANPKIRKVNQNTFLATWTDIHKTRLMGRYIQQSGTGLSATTTSTTEFTIATDNIRAYDVEIMGNTLAIAVHKKERIQLYGLAIPFSFPLPPSIPLIGEVANPHSTYSNEEINLTAGDVNYMLSWTNGGSKITYIIANTIPGFSSSPRKEIDIHKYLVKYSPCFDFKNRKYVLAMQNRKSLGGSYEYGLEVICIDASSSVESGIAPVIFSIPTTDPTERVDEVRNQDRDNCLACKENNKYSYSGKFNRLIGLSNYSKDSDQLLLVFESETEEKKEITGRSDINIDCSGSIHDLAYRCRGRSFPEVETRKFARTYYAYIDYTGSVESGSYEVLSEEQGNQSISDDPTSFQVFSSTAPNNGSPFITVRRIKKP